MMVCGSLLLMNYELSQTFQLSKSFHGLCNSEHPGETEQSLHELEMHLAKEHVLGEGSVCFRGL